MILHFQGMLRRRHGMPWELVHLLGARSHVDEP